MIGRWRSLGPLEIDEGIRATGRIMALAIDPTDSTVMYAGTVSGDPRGGGGCGIWKTTTSANSWLPIGDGLPNHEVLAILIDPSSPQTIFAATRNLQRQGAGFFRSDNGGATWQVVSADARLTGRRVAIHRDRPNIMLMETSTALLRTDDTGQSWQTVLSNSTVRVTDIAMDPSDPDVLYAGVLDTSGSAVGGVYRSTDAGISWTRLAGCTGQLLPTPGPNTVVRVAVSRGRVYAALKSAGAFRVFRTTNTDCTADGVRQRGWEQRWQAPSSVVPTLWSFLYADPTDDRFVYMTGTSFRVSTDGGNTFSVSAGPHVDHHALVVDPQNTAVVFTGCDGGIYRSNNHAASGSWKFCAAGLVNTEFYDLADATTDPDLLIGGTQDNGTIRIEDSADPWDHIRGGDGATVAIDPTDHRILYSMGQYAASIARSTNGGSFQNIAQGLPGGSTCFNLHYHVHPTVPSTLLASCGALWRTTTSVPPGNWRAIFQPANGSVVRSAVDPISDVYFAGTDAGELFAGPGGGAWSQIMRLTDIVPSAGNQNVVDIHIDPDSNSDLYLAFGGGGDGRVVRLRRIGTPSPLDITADLPTGLRVRSIAVDRNHPHTILAGTSHGGVYRGTSSDGGNIWRWLPFNDGLPAVCDVRRVLPHPRTGVVRVGTFGRGAYEVDTAEPIGRLTAAQGKIAMLRVHDRGTGFGPDWDFIDVEAVVRLANSRDAYGFQIRRGKDLGTHQAMLDTLRDAFNDDRTVRIEYTRTGLHHGVVLRVLAI